MGINVLELHKIRLIKTDIPVLVRSLKSSISSVIRFLFCEKFVRVHDPVIREDPFGKRGTHDYE